MLESAALRYEITFFSLAIMDGASYEDPQQHEKSLAAALFGADVPGPASESDSDLSTSSASNFDEAIYLFIVAAVGCFLNLAVIGCILTCRSLRRMTSAFVLHGCVLDALKCLYCIPFATSLLKDIEPGSCNFLGGSYVVIVTASGFNIVAMICCEAYIFSEHNIGGPGRGSFSCVVFGVIMVYIGSIIIHLGPTIIGGDFSYNELIGNCIFQYGTIKSYVAHVMWIAIMSLAMVGSVYYLAFFYRHVQANSTHRLASLVRASIAVSRGNTDRQDIRKVIRESLGRARVLMILTAIFITCWYPLFILTLVDPNFRQPAKVYKLLSFIAWSNAALDPLAFLLFDQHINLLWRGRQACGQRASCRRCDVADDDVIEHGEPQMPLMSGSSGPASLYASRAGTPQTRRAGNVSRSESKRSQSEFQGASVYQRVGCRLCQEGQSHPTNSHCNGGVGPSVRRDDSICQLHQYTVM